jgi:hypothetical protein
LDVRSPAAVIPQQDGPSRIWGNKVVTLREVPERL